MKIALSRSLILLVMIFFARCEQLLAQEEKPCSQMQYEHNNMVDYGPLRVSKVKGTVRDIGGVSIQKGCVGLFSKDDNRLVAWTNIASDGSFEIPKVRSGDYKLIISVQWFCAPNANIRVGHSLRKKHSLVAIMKPRGIDDCSWIEAK